MPTQQTPGLMCLPVPIACSTPADPFVPFPSIAWVRSAPEFVNALVKGTTPYILVLSNISVSPDLWQQAAEEQGQQLALRRNVEIAGWPGRACVIDWQGATNIVSLGSNTAKLREWSLGQGVDTPCMCS